VCTEAITINKRSAGAVGLADQRPLMCSFCHSDLVAYDKQSNGSSCNRRISVTLRTAGYATGRRQSEFAYSVYPCARADCG